MKVVLAFDSFKGCMSAREACHTAAEAIRSVLPHADIVECPLSDGGEGLVDCVSEILPVQRITIKAHDPLMNQIDASYVISSLPFGGGLGRGFIEMSSTSGLTLVPPEKRNPLLTTTYGVGEMILDAVHRGCTEIVLGIGGSATCDGGRGMLQCLKERNSLPLGNIQLTIASDVTNPLYGPNGAAYVFAPQKGATPEQVVELDKRLRDFARETEALGLATPQLAKYPGAGAAGGLGYGLMAYLGAELKSGIDIMLDISNFNTLIKGADIIITGEGQSDRQTLMGKVPCGVLKRAKCITVSASVIHDYEARPQVWLLSGAVEDSDGALSKSFDVVKSINAGDNRPTDVLLHPSVAQNNLRRTIISQFCQFSA